jgi:phosphoribosylaminoimidazolecarboxamide formyltransferase/IMP cyclohydrolase
MPSSLRTALLSVSDKTGILEFARFLEGRGVRLLSTGGTAEALRKAGVAVTDISAHTGFPEMMDGRIKTLHPTVHGGILAVRGNAAHQQAMQEHRITGIDLVVVNLYPFEATVARGEGAEACIENIDIGGPAMIRSAAKNHHDVTVLVDPADYAAVQEEMTAQGGATTPTLRRRLAAKAFARTAAYDAAIAQWCAGQEKAMPPFAAFVGTLQQPLRYGENPHQLAAFYASGERAGTLAGARQVQGKELSYNNLNDSDAALALVRECAEPAVAIIKHANPCGVAVGTDALTAYRRAFACDPQSAFGGIIALNRPLDAATAEAITAVFSEVILAPSANAEALAICATRKNLRVLLLGEEVPPPSSLRVKVISGGFLVQEHDGIVCDETAFRVVTQRAPTKAELRDLRFAFTVAKHVKSNAIVLARGGQTVGIGAGQMSRVDSVRIAAWKARESGLETTGAVLASDAFFPFDDNVHSAQEAGITALIQPGGSVRDAEVIAAADRYGMAMIFTGIRHFNH